MYICCFLCRFLFHVYICFNIIMVFFTETMPAVFVCPLCQDSFGSTRLLRRHSRYVHKIIAKEDLSITIEARAVIEELQEPPQVSIDFENVVPDVLDVIEMSPVSVPEPQRTSVAIQTSGAWRTPPLDYQRTRPRKPRSRRRLFGLGMHDDDKSSIQFHERSPSANLQQLESVRTLTSADPRSVRRLCNCESCVNHALTICRTFPLREGPAADIRMTKLLGVTSSETSAQQELLRETSSRPDAFKTLCGCKVCIAHRLLCLAIRAASQVSPEIKL